MLQSQLVQFDTSNINIRKDVTGIAAIEDSTKQDSKYQKEKHDLEYIESRVLTNLIKLRKKADLQHVLKSTCVIFFYTEWFGDVVGIYTRMNDLALKHPLLPFFSMDGHNPEFKVLKPD